MARLKNMKGQSAKQMNDIFGRMMKLGGKDPLQVLSAEQIQKYLTEAFNNFDTTSDGYIDFTEFSKAWASLGLDGTTEELRTAFNTVDTDRSGKVDLEEFISCVKDSRLEELGMRVLLESIGMEMDEIENLFGSYSDRYENFKKSAERRRLMRRQYEEGIEKNTKAMIVTLANITGDAEADSRDPKQMEFYNQVRDTFNAFDKDGR